ncbi:Stp1/IreP family PP2C-type Ser/Thr phosphatase [Alkaliphilus transvaalensis]|uniref:Stp1/IreP family PP2C-type Ser/Thr phosphatase n=1 Tax=Alkaliphilus transvaalensis TaxID=114628 RepID=UPI00047A981B|nr:Stp1/IreP family PP2C-type Ser/Thr phosphatase [Alkaliphilus transvaalensis]
MNIGAITDIGKVREINEDNFCIFNEGIELYLVADGMGGHNAGEVASQIAIDTIKEHIIRYISEEMDDLDDESVKGILFEAFNRANREILNRSKTDDQCEGMGTTATLIIKLKERLYIAHIGDSRAYLIRNKEIRQLTQDHSLVAELVRRGSISEREAMKHPQKNVITRALGTDDYIKVDLLTSDIQPLDILVLCTDGLSNFVDKYEIEKLVLEVEDCDDCCRELVSLANQRGGFDNITVIVVKNNINESEGR